MIAKHHFASYTPDGLMEGLGLKPLFAFLSAKAVRGGPRLLPQIAICVSILLILTRLLPTRLTDIAFGSSYTKILKWKPTEDYEDGSVGGGLRIVVFGGGDIATPNKAPEEQSWNQDTSWTEILCQQLEDCDAHLSYMPWIDVEGGSLLSNSMYETVLNRIAASPNASAGPGIDYTWLSDHYPVPSRLPDLEGQIDAFLATTPPRHPPRETLWVFNYGYWDIWKLAAIPRVEAMELLELQVEHLFSQIEVLYQQARTEDSIAYSDFYTILANTSAPPSENTTAVVLDVPPEPFRIFIPSLFDISLTPGFETVRFNPPFPHSRAEEMRNAAYLTDQWEQLVAAMIRDWIATPDPVVTGTSNETILVEKRDASGNQVFVPNARREAITYDTPKYIREQIVERQLRDAEVQDHNGWGNKPEKDGYLDVREPCMPLNMAENATATATVSAKKRTESEQAVLPVVEGMCSTPDEHLFWTEFTVGQRTINQIGQSAAKRYKVHVQKGGQWLKKGDQAELLPREWYG
ncbi:hypothetical protein BJ170DRAFT_64708 [Xylariales sp. AK1849]|nr:hypothetical protein BJ170DRAFT_64708 [Xylariales sp. AK1849]